MRKKLIPLCLVLVSHMAIGQRSYQYEAPDRLFMEGKDFFELKNYPGAIDKLEAYKLKAKDADLIQEADYMLAYAAFEQGREDADRVLKEYLDTYPDARHRDEMNFLVASVYFDREEYQKAIFWFHESNMDLLCVEQQEAYSYRLAYALLQTGEVEKARGYFTRIQQIGSTYREAASYYVAYIDYVNGAYEDALVAFSRLKDIPAYKEQSLYYITQIYFIQNKYERVIGEGEALLTAYPSSKNNNEMYRILGNSYYHQGDQDKAIDRLSQYVSSAEAPLRGDLYILGVSYFNKGNFNSAVNAFGRTVTQDDLLTQNAYLYLGQSYLRLKDKNNARMAFEAAATASYDEQIREVALYNYALLIHETRFTGFGESVSIFEDFLNDFPNSQYADKVNDYLVEVYLTTKNYDAALTSIEKIKKPSAKILEAKQDILFQLGTQAFTNVKLENALTYFTRAIDLGTYNADARNDAYFWRGESLYRKGEFQKAIADYRTYLNNTRQRNTDMYALAHYNLGYSSFKLKDYSEALSRFTQYTQLEKDQRAATYADAFNRIGDCLFHNRQFAQAEENYNKAAEVSPSAGDYSIYQKGFVLGLQKDYRGKVREMDRLIREFPESQYVDDALYEKGRSYVLLEEDNQAATTFDILMEQFPHSSLARKAGVQLGLIYFNGNQPEKAAAAYKRVISNYPGSEEARVALNDLRSVYVDLNDIQAYTTYVNSLGGYIYIDVPQQDSLTYIAAERLFLRGDNDAARRSMGNYLQNFPEGAFHSNANYYLGSIAFTNKEYENAKQYFVRVLDSGDTKFREESLARKAEIEYLNKDYAEAMTTFKQLSAFAENPVNKEAAKLGLMRSAQFLEQPKEALLAANDLLKDSKLSPELIAEARYIRAKAHISLGQETLAVDDLKELSKDTRTVHGAEAKYLLAQGYYDNNDDAQAIQILEEYAKNGTPHQYWLARGFILWADIYIRQGDDVQARVYLNSLQNNYKADDDIAGMIEDRLGKLKK
ncbi:outer membrane protein assembly factor BamD [Parabacteroides sp. 52]|uniref:tetratricopeptide repeat protein n=1 Tax=unclassified Parabacteroides TaxID=2649774 RepID=UPI0013D0CAB0|nr:MULTISPECIES: tetratricopeptide repeat protein [unclassified Parabacteroides]MDH6535123.1 TolA-binding protein [Parabacteroides sp. PM5-20]NDV55477.1 outer membrane protein assembly factor BamD [Parabacteroides sp. 52]